MKVCIPTLGDGGSDAAVSEHFGRAPTFTVHDTETDETWVVSNEGEHHGGSASPPNLIADTGADVLVCGNLGRKAIDRFDELDITVYRGAEGTVDRALQHWQADDLDEAQPGEDCGHGHGDQGHHHGDHDHGHGHGDHDHAHGHGDHDHGH